MIGQGGDASVVASDLLVVELADLGGIVSNEPVSSPTASSAPPSAGTRMIQQRSGQRLTRADRFLHVGHCPGDDETLPEVSPQCPAPADGRPLTPSKPRLRLEPAERDLLEQRPEDRASSASPDRRRRGPGLFLHHATGTSRRSPGQHQDEGREDLQQRRHRHQHPRGNGRFPTETRDGLRTPER